MTREDLLAHLAARRARNIMLTWAQFTAAIGAAPQSTRDQILLAANTADGRTLTTAIVGAVAAKRKALARAEVDAVAADDTLTVDELIALLS